MSVRTYVGLITPAVSRHTTLTRGQSYRYIYGYTGLQLQLLVADAPQDASRNPHADDNPEACTRNTLGSTPEYSIALTSTDHDVANEH